MWTCPYCAEVNKNLWIARMLYATETIGGDWSFVTLTAHRKIRGESASHKNLAEGWNRLNLRAKRAFPAFSYVRVWEHHKKGAFHAHILWSGRPSKRWLKDNSAECGMGFMADSSELKSDRFRAVFYVAKYMTKEEQKFPKGVRRIVCSRNFPEKTLTEASEWRVVGEKLEEFDAVSLAWSKGKTIYDIQEKREITTDDFDEKLES